MANENVMSEAEVVACLSGYPKGSWRTAFAVAHTGGGKDMVLKLECTNPKGALVAVVFRVPSKDYSSQKQFFLGKETGLSTQEPNCASRSVCVDGICLFNAKTVAPSVHEERDNRIQRPASYWDTGPFAARIWNSMKTSPLWVWANPFYDAHMEEQRRKEEVKSRQQSDLLRTAKHKL